jgi:hypothetical protein
LLNAGRTDLNYEQASKLKATGAMMNEMESIYWLGSFEEESLELRYSGESRSVNTMSTSLIYHFSLFNSSSAPLHGGP